MKRASIVAVALLLVTASCDYLPPLGSWTPQWGPVQGQLTLSNYRFGRASIEAIVTPSPDCAAVDPASGAAAFDLPFKGTRVIVAAPKADICWRRQLASGQWTDWNRAFTGSGRFIDSQL